MTATGTAAPTERDMLEHAVRQFVSVSRILAAAEAGDRDALAADMRRDQSMGGGSTSPGDTYWDRDRDGVHFYYLDRIYWADDDPRHADDPRTAAGLDGGYDLRRRPVGTVDFDDMADVIVAGVAACPDAVADARTLAADWKALHAGPYVQFGSPEWKDRQNPAEYARITDGFRAVTAAVAAAGIAATPEQGALF